MKVKHLPITVISSAVFLRDYLFVRQELTLRELLSFDQSGGVVEWSQESSGL